MKKFLNLSLVISMLFIATAANANEVKIGKKVYSNAQAVGIGTDESFYTIAVGDTTSVQDVTTALVFYIPKEIFANGTYDLASLPNEVDSIDDAVKQCEEVEETGEDSIVLPDSNKVYLVGSSTKIKQKGKFFRGKGLSIADKNFKAAQITISGIGSSENAPLIENVTLTLDNVKLPVFKVNYKVFVSEDCEEIANKSKFKASKKAKNAKVSVDVTAQVLTVEIPNF